MLVGLVHGVPNRCAIGVHGSQSGDREPLARERAGLEIVYSGNGAMLLRRNIPASSQELRTYLRHVPRELSEIPLHTLPPLVRAMLHQDAAGHLPMNGLCRYTNHKYQLVVPLENAHEYAPPSQLCASTSITVRACPLKHAIGLAFHAIYGPVIHVILPIDTSIGAIANVWQERWMNKVRHMDKSEGRSSPSLTERVYLGGITPAELMHALILLYPSPVVPVGYIDPRGPGVLKGKWPSPNLHAERGIVDFTDGAQIVINVPKDPQVSYDVLLSPDLADRPNATWMEVVYMVVSDPKSLCLLQRDKSPLDLPKLPARPMKLGTDRNGILQSYVA
jgi:hypothetical protein